SHQVARLHLASSFDVGRTGLESHEVVLLQLELGRVLDGDDAVVVGDHGRQYVQQRRLPGARPAAHQDVQLALDTEGQELGQLRRQRAELDEVDDVERLLRELANRESGTVEREGRDDRIYAGAVGQPRVDHRRRAVDAAAQ